MTRFAQALAITTAVAAGSIALAGPAAADHYLAPGQTSCYAGAVAAGLPRDFDTKFVEIVDNGDGTVTAICTFRGIPGKVKKPVWSDREDGTWVRPGPGTTYDGVQCFLQGEQYAGSPNYMEDYGVHAAWDQAAFTYVEGGTAVAVCTFDLVDSIWD